MKSDFCDYALGGRHGGLLTHFHDERDERGTHRRHLCAAHVEYIRTCVDPGDTFGRTAYWKALPEALQRKRVSPVVIKNRNK